MSLIIGSLFSGLKDTAIDARAFFGISFLSIMFLSMGAMPELGITFSNKPCALALYILHRCAFPDVDTHCFFAAEEQKKAILS